MALQLAYVVFECDRSFSNINTRTPTLSNINTRTPRSNTGTMSAIQDYIEKLGLEIAQRTRLAFRNHGMIPTIQVARIIYTLT